MNIKVFKDKFTLARVAADQAATIIRKAISDKGTARIIAATGASQFEFLDALTAMRDIDWKHVEMFHLDEYIGIPMSHPASFRSYLLKRLINKVGITHYHLLDGESDPALVAREVGAKLASAPVDIAFVGIGENCHLAFNDPPADFETDDPYLVVTLDEACRRQQLGEGWFPSLEAVPKRAISMSIRQILRSRHIVLSVPDARKAAAVRAAVEGPVSPDYPASVLQRHESCALYLDPPAASMLSAPGGAGAR